MQYQVFKKETGELVAWIRENGESIVHRNYSVKRGENLKVVEEGDIMKVEDTKKIRVKFFDKEVYPEGLQKIGGKRSDWIDLRASKTIDLKKGDLVYIPLGVAMELPEGYEAIVAPRSSSPKNFFILQANSIGVIDESFRGDNDQWMMPALAFADTTIYRGDRVCQFRIIEHQPEVEFEVVDSLGNKDRGGWGSSGKN